VKYLPLTFRHSSSLLLVNGRIPVRGCRARKRRPQGDAYVSAPQAFLRDQVAAVYNKIGKREENGEAVQIVAREPAVSRGCAHRPGPKGVWSSGYL